MHAARQMFIASPPLRASAPVIRCRVEMRKVILSKILELLRCRGERGQCRQCRCRTVRSRARWPSRSAPPSPTTPRCSSASSRPAVLGPPAPPRTPPATKPTRTFRYFPPYPSSAHASDFMRVDRVSCSCWQFCSKLCGVSAWHKERATSLFWRRPFNGILHGSVSL